LSEAATGTLFERISSREGLEEGWRMVLAKDASDGILQRKTKEFAEHLDDFLTELSESLRSGTYEPDPLLSFGIPKGTSGEVRTLHIPSIRDRVVERAVVNAIAHRADLTMSPCSSPSGWWRRAFSSRFSLSAAKPTQNTCELGRLATACRISGFSANSMVGGTAPASFFNLCSAVCAGL